jgi:hypothetical protein
MSWTSTEDIKGQLLRRWERGDLLREWIRQESTFPLRLTLKGPTAGEIAQRFEEVREWIAALHRSPLIRIECKDVKHRVMGTQRIPVAAWIDTRENALDLLGKQRDSERFQQLLTLTGVRHSPLVAWMERYPLRAVGLSDEWARLLRVAQWMQANPRPNVYLRHVGIAGVHSKFIEGHLGVLGEWFDLLLPEDAIDANHTGARNFAARYGFLDKPNQVRFRVLDAGLGLLAGTELPDVTLDGENFAKLRAPIRHVFIIENEVTFLAFPPVANSIVIFGAGYGFRELGLAAWIAQCSVHYWGDIDTHGFAILDQLRRRFAHAKSFLMDRSTLMAHELLWGSEESQIMRDLPRLTTAESSLYNDLRDNRMAGGLRLEQERIGVEWLKTTLGHLVAELRECEATSN